MKTKKGNFDIKYSHIDAPTFTDDSLSKIIGRRVLCDPLEKPEQKKIWREPELEYLAKAKWCYKRKLDGENIRVLWDGEKAVWNGKTNDFACKPPTEEYMNNTFLEEIFEEKFGRDKQVLLFGERMGPKCQGNELGLEEEELVLFDVKIGECWLEPKNIASIAKYFGVKSCYDYMPTEIEECESTLEKLIHKVTKGDFKGWEGVVAIPAVGVLNRKGERIIVKIKNKEYLR